MHNINKRTIFLLFISLPIFIYFGERSYISQDEGFYALQAKWIIDNNNWIAPSWWGEILYDRTILTQWTIAISQMILGKNIFAAHVPSLIAGCCCIVYSTKLSNLLIGNKYYFITPIILLTSYIWVDNLHLSTQDMSLVAIEIFCIYKLYRIRENDSNYNFLIIGICIGIATFFKTAMILVFIISLIPFIYIQRYYIIKNKYFWLGFVIGFIPLVLWIYKSINEYGIDSVSLLFYKITDLSTSEKYSQSNYFYIWNILITHFPWSILAILSSIKILKRKNYPEKLILIIYPLILVSLLSLFKTKTSYYPLQISPFISILASYQIRDIILRYSEFKLIKNIFILIGLLFLSIIIYTFQYMNLNSTYNNYFYITICISILLISISWILIVFTRSYKAFLMLILIGPYLAFSFLVQRGIFSNRHPQIKNLLKQEFTSQVTLTNKSKVFYSGELSNKEFSLLVKIGLYTNIDDKKIEKIDIYSTQTPIWTRKNETAIDFNNYEIIFKDDLIAPWILVKKEGRL